MSPKEIAEKILILTSEGIIFTKEIIELARAYLELENKLQVTNNNWPHEKQLHEEITKLKTEIERLNSYVILGYETVHKESLEEITRLIEENLKLEEQVFKDTEYIGYIQDQLELSKSVLLQKTLEIDSLRNPIEYLNKLAASIHQTNVEAGWWTDLATGEPLERNVGELLCLVHSEVSEALEAYRKSLMDDKLPHRTGFEVELADALIRIFDIAGKFMLDLDGAVEEKMAYNAKRADHTIASRKAQNGKKF